MIFTTKNDTNLLVMKVYGDSISMNKIGKYEVGLKEIGLMNTKIEIIPTTEITMADLANIDNKISGIKDMTTQLNVVKNQKSEDEKLISKLRDELQSYKIDSISFKQLCDEIKILQPDVTEVTLARGKTSDLSVSGKEQSILAIVWKNKARNQKERQEYLYNFLKLRMKNDSLKVIDIIAEK
jgi:hypothetical protein